MMRSCSYWNSSRENVAAVPSRAWRKDRHKNVSKRILPFNAKAIWIFWMHSPGWRSDCGTLGGCPPNHNILWFTMLFHTFIHTFKTYFSSLMFDIVLVCRRLRQLPPMRFQVNPSLGKSILLSESQSFSRKITTRYLLKLIIPIATYYHLTQSGNPAA